MRTTARSSTKLSRIALLVAALAGSPGCYYAHLASGQARLLMARRPVTDVLADPTTSEELAGGIRLVGEALAFAARLGLDVDAQYTSFVDWPGDRVVTTVVATRPGEVEARGFWFPLVGTVPYKGFFAPELAAREAERLSGDGLDTCLFPVVAYSTLGWFDDPLTGPMLRLEADRLVETVLHELVHATVFVASEPDFNEGIATFIGQEAAIRFAAERGDDRVRARVADDRALARVLEAHRSAVEALYRDVPPGAEREAGRARLEEETRGRLGGLPLRTRDAAAYAGGVRLNDACQALLGTYQDDLAEYATKLAALGGDLAAFLAAARDAAEQDDPRRALLGGPAAHR